MKTIVCYDTQGRIERVTMLMDGGAACFTPAAGHSTLILDPERDEIPRGGHWVDVSGDRPVLRPRQPFPNRLTAQPDGFRLDGLPPQTQVEIHHTASWVSNRLTIDDGVLDVRSPLTGHFTIRLSAHPRYHDTKLEVVL